MSNHWLQQTVAFESWFERSSGFGCSSVIHCGRTRICSVTCASNFILLPAKRRTALHWDAWPQRVSVSATAVVRGLHQEAIWTTTPKSRANTWVDVRECVVCNPCVARPTVRGRESERGFVTLYLELEVKQMLSRRATASPRGPTTSNSKSGLIGDSLSEAS